MELKTGTRIWIAAGFTDLRRGFHGLSSLVETVLEQQPYLWSDAYWRMTSIWFSGEYCWCSVDMRTS